jgi:hypothetical protein
MRMGTQPKSGNLIGRGVRGFPQKLASRSRAVHFDQVKFLTDTVVAPEITPFALHRDWIRFFGEENLLG